MNVGDAEVFHALNSNPDVMRYTGEPPMRSIEQAAEAIENYPDFETVGYGRWASVLRTTGEVIGFCGLKYLDDLEEVDVGFRYFPEHWGQGYATEAGAASIAFGFDVLGLERIIALVLPENAASIRVIEKIGLRADGAIQYDGFNALKYTIHRRNHRPEHSG